MEIPDAELRQRLLALGYNPPPITSTSRSILLKKLKSLEAANNGESDSNFDGNTESPSESNSQDESTEEAANIIRQRISKSNFVPKNVGMYSRCYVKNADLWDRIGIVGTTLVLLSATLVIFFIFKFIGDWSDRRYRSVHLNEGVFPKCSEGGNPGSTCVPDSEFKFTESNLNVLRAALHHATLTERCSSSSWKSSDFIGLYPVFKYDYIRNMLTETLAFKETEADTLLRNAKVLFKANPRLEVKVLDDGLLYRNQRLLRSCGYMSWNSVAYSYALYFLASFAGVWFTYKLNRWVNKLRNDNGEERRRLIKDIYDILKQCEKQTGSGYVSVKQVREWLDREINLKPKFWDDMILFLREYEESIYLEIRIVHGEECEVFCLKK